jgi:hypothetical protein
MDYVPATANLKADGKTYDVLDQMMKSLSSSPASKDPKSPEYELLQLLNTPDADYVQTFTKRVNAYLRKVSDRLTHADTQATAVGEYMVLAEGRRKLYKGREDMKPDGPGLDEFALTLPSAMKWPLPLTQMTESGDVVAMPEASVDLFRKLNEKRLMLWREMRTPLRAARLIGEGQPRVLVLSTLRRVRDYSGGLGWLIVK